MPTNYHENIKSRTYLLLDANSQPQKCIRLDGGEYHWHDMFGTTRSITNNSLSVASHAPNRCLPEENSVPIINALPVARASPTVLVFSRNVAKSWGNIHSSADTITNTVFTGQIYDWRGDRPTQKMLAYLDIVPAQRQLCELGETSHLGR